MFLVPLENTPRDWLLQVLGFNPQVRQMSKTLPQIIAAQVEKAITEAGYRSQDEFANAVGIPRATLNRVLSGRFDNRISTLEKIAAGLELSIANFLTGSGGGKRNSSLHTIGPKKKSSIVVKIIVPSNEAIPDWLSHVCSFENARLSRSVAPKEKRKTSCHDG